MNRISCTKKAGRRSVACVALVLLSMSQGCRHKSRPAVDSATPPIPANAVLMAPSPEPMCPGGLSPEPGIVFCDDFETGDQSRWGHAPAFDTDPPQRLLVSESVPFLGRYSLEFVYSELRGPTYQWTSLPDLEEIRLRFYIYLDDLYHWGFGRADHVITIDAKGGVTCAGGLGLDLGPYGPRGYLPTVCNGKRLDDLEPNMGSLEDRTIHNGRWYCIEMRIKANTIGGCEDLNGNQQIDPAGECDGIFEVWVDGRPVLGYYDLNFRGNDNADWRMTQFLFNHYYRTGGQTFAGRSFREFRDNLVVAGGERASRPIGPAAGAPAAKGQPDPLSPFQTHIYKSWFAFDGEGNALRPGSDCTNSLVVNGDWMNSRVPVSYVAVPAHNETSSHCSGIVPPGNDRALRVTTLSGHDFGGGGLDGERGLPGRTHVLRGWIYLDPLTFPAPNGAAMAGMIAYSDEGRDYVALGVDGANHPVLLQQRDNDSGAPLEILDANPDVTVTPGTWHVFEVRGSESGDWSVLLNGMQTLEASGVDGEFLWKQWSYHWGISDHLGNPGPLTIYVDDVSAGSTSFEDCFGWSDVACPFAERGS